VRRKVPAGAGEGSTCSPMAASHEERMPQPRARCLGQAVRKSSCAPRGRASSHVAWTSVGSGAFAGV
jgi:hypothetical protein